MENGEELFTLTVARAGETILVMPFSLILSPQASVRIRCLQLFDTTPENPVLDRVEDDDTLTLIEGADPGGRYHLLLTATDLVTRASTPVRSWKVSENAIFSTALSSGVHDSLALPVNWGREEASQSV